MKSIAVVGGGAAGYFAAIAAAETNPQAKVVIFEQGRKTLAKVAVSGGGRCNVTHHCFDPKELVRFYPRGAKELRGAFHVWQPQDTVHWFESRGVALKTEADGRMFPTTDDAQTIIDCLESAAAKAGVEVRLKAGVAAVERGDGAFRLTLSDGSAFDASALILATGGGRNSIGHAIATQLGHSLSPLAPSLFTFHIEHPLLEGMQGLSLPNARVRYAPAKLELSGPILVTHWGLSGPAVLKLSAWGARVLQEVDYRFEIAVSWLGDLSANSARDGLESAKRSQARKALANFNPFELPRRFWERLLFCAAASPETQWAQLPKACLNQLVASLVDCRLQVAGKSMNKEEFVTCGGVLLKEVDFKTLQSKRCEGLFFAGEVLDIDGVTGGFNFQAAWTTGRIAGQAAANSLRL